LNLNSLLVAIGGWLETSSMKRLGSFLKNLSFVVSIRFEGSSLLFSKSLYRFL
jgi:hypothetical protein